MALQSSGQISLSQIRNEFALGSGQIAMSSLYGKGNAPASGQIRMAANFYGTSNVIHTTSFTAGLDSFKAGRDITGYDIDTATGNNSIGSITSPSFTYNGETITIWRINEDQIGGNRLAFSKAGTPNYEFTGWTKATITGVGVFLRANSSWSSTVGFGISPSSGVFIWDLNNNQSYTLTIE